MAKIVTLLFLWGTVAVSNADFVKIHPYPLADAFGQPAAEYGTPVEVVKFEQKPIIVPPAPELEPIVRAALPELPLRISTYVDGGRVVTSTGKHVLPVIPPAPELSPFLSHFIDSAGYSKFPAPIPFAIANDEKYKYVPQAPILPAISVQELFSKYLSEGKLFTNNNAIELLAKNGVVVLNPSKDAKFSSPILSNLLSPVVISLCQQFLSNQAASFINNVPGTIVDKPLLIPEPPQLPPSSDVIPEPVRVFPEYPPVTVVVPPPPALPPTTLPEIPSTIFDETPVLAPYPPALAPIIPPAPEIVAVKPPPEFVVETNPLVVPPPPELPLAELPDIPNRIFDEEPVISAPYPAAILPVIPPAPELIEVKPALPIPFLETQYPPKPHFVPQPPELPPFVLPNIPTEIVEEPVKVLPYPAASPVIPPAPELVNLPPVSVPEYPPFFEIKESGVFSPTTLGVIPPAPEIPAGPLPIVPERVVIQKPEFIRERINVIIPQPPQLPAISLPEIPTPILEQGASRIISPCPPLVIPRPPEVPLLPVPEYGPPQSIGIVPGTPARVYGPPAEVYGSPF